MPSDAHDSNEQLLLLLAYVEGHSRSLQFGSKLSVFGGFSPACGGSPYVIVGSRFPVFLINFMVMHI